MRKFALPIEQKVHKFDTFIASIKVKVKIVCFTLLKLFWGLLLKIVMVTVYTSRTPLYQLDLHLYELFGDDECSSA